MNFKSIQTIPILILIGCSVTHHQQKGIVEPMQFHSELGFDTYKGVIGIDTRLGDSTKTFLFDTGADLTLIQSDSMIGRTSKFSGASKRQMELGRGIIPSIQIGTVRFKDTYALNGDMTGLKEQIPNFGGIIGQSIIRKANWLINYPNKTIQLSNENLVDSSFAEIEITRENGNNPYTYLKVNDKTFKVVIDLGSTSVINVPVDSDFAAYLSQSLELSDHTRDRYTLGGLQRITEKVGTLPKVTLGDFEFEAVEVNINTSSQPRIGMRFFKDYSIYIANSEGGAYKLKKIAVGSGDGDVP